jgi:hypothetical protein
VTVKLVGLACQSLAVVDNKILHPPNITLTQLPVFVLQPNILTLCHFAPLYTVFHHHCYRDPSSLVDFSDVLYNDDDLISAFYNALRKDGILLSQTGNEESIKDAARSLSAHKPLEEFTNQLERVGFKAVKEYSEGHVGCMEPWHFIIAFKDMLSKVQWFSNEAELSLKLKTSSVPTVDGKSPFYFFDAATMMTYQYPSRIIEEVFCRKDPEPEGCDMGHGYETEIPNIPITSFDVRQSTVEGAGRGVYFKEDFPDHSYLAIDSSSYHMFIPPITNRIVKSMLEHPDYGEPFRRFNDYVFAYGFYNEYFGLPAAYVDAEVLTFMNHGCDGTNNVGLEASEASEATVSLTEIPDVLGKSPYRGMDIYQPYMDRHVSMYAGSGDVTLRDVKADEEVLDNYLAYAPLEDWASFVQYLRDQCSSGRGPVAKYEAESQ